MTAVVMLVVLVPLLTGGATVLAGHRDERLARGLAVGGSAITLLLALVVAPAHLGDRPALHHVLAATSGPGPSISAALLVDPLTAVMLLLAGTVAFLVQVFSLGYLAGDRRYPSYAALVSLFTGAMALVVVADDLWALLIGWELMGACSYFLISHHWEQPEARAGAVKAFLITRTADLGLLFGILVLGERFGSYRISAIMAGIGEADFARDDLWLPAVLLLVAALGKSAQFPFHTWLPDAMPGPTPISALIHAATMVAAGVFLVARVYPLFLSTPSVLTLLAAVAAITMLLAAVRALRTDDLKRVLAWSTVSQLAYMFAALAAGAWTAGVLHLLAHGAFKALLFLSAGSVVHAIGGSTSMEVMGGLRRRLPHTFVVMTCGFAGLAGVVPFVGFFSKDAVIGATLEQATDGRLVWGWVAWALFLSTVLTAALTVAYSMRAWLLVFFGPGTEGNVHEAPPSMRVPLYVLAVPTLVGGVVLAFPAKVLGLSAAEAPLFHLSMAVAMTALVALVGLLVWSLWRRNGLAAGRSSESVTDRGYDLAVVRPLRWLSRLVRAGDRDVIDAYANGAAGTTTLIGRALRAGQNGNVQGYLTVVVVGAAVVTATAAVLAGALS